MLQNKKDPIFFHGYFVDLILRVNAYLQKGLKNPNWLLMSTLGRFTIVRNVVVRFSRNKMSEDQTVKEALSLFREVNASDVVESLERDGLYLGLQLPQDILNKIIAFALSTPCYGNQDSKLGFLYPDKDKLEKQYGHTFFMAQYHNTCLSCPEIQKLSHDPKLLEIAALYLKTQPVFTGSRLWWNFAVDNQQPYDSSQTITFFHYDLDDYACLRFFFYLTDVDAESGPHVCVYGSHKNKSLLHRLMPVKRRTDDEISTFYGKESIVKIMGERGFGFAEDTFCYHKATRPRSHDRLMLQIQFATADYGLHNDTKDPSQLTSIV